jgi:hypothetical protein
LTRRSAKADRLKKLSDGGGLQLWVTPGGAKIWRYAYRYAGRQKLLALGAYPTVTLASARAARDAAIRHGGPDDEIDHIEEQVKAGQRRAERCCGYVAFVERSFEDVCQFSLRTGFLSSSRSEASCSIRGGWIGGRSDEKLNQEALDNYLRFSAYGRFGAPPSPCVIVCAVALTASPSVGKSADLIWDENPIRQMPRHTVSCGVNTGATMTVLPA